MKPKRTGWGRLSTVETGTLPNGTPINLESMAPLHTFTAEDGDIEYRVLAGDRLPDLARVYYGHERYWWVIAQANGITLADTQLAIRETVTIPSPVDTLKKLS